MTYDTKGIFRCYEVKVSKADFHSAAVKSFVGHYNYYVLMRDGSYVIVDRLCEATTQMLEIIRKQEEIIEQCRISDELHKELDDMKSDVDQKMDLIEYDLRSYRRERGE